MHKSRWRIATSVAAASLCCLSCSPSSTQIKAPSTKTADLDLGTVRAGSKASGTLRITNGSKQKWMITQVDSSCPCLSVKPIVAECGLGETTEISVNLDLTHEPDFRGILLIELEGKEADSRVDFLARVAALVSD